MKRFIELFPKIVLGILLLGCACFSAVVVFTIGGNEGTLEVAGDILDIPNYTDPLFYFCYVLLGLAILASLYSVGVEFIGKCKSDKKAAIKSVCGILLLAIICVVCWFLGSPEEIQILGYEGSENVGFWAQMTDTVLYATYILAAVTVVVIIWGFVHTQIKK